MSAFQLSLSVWLYAFKLSILYSIRPFSQDSLKTRTEVNVDFTYNIDNFENVFVLHN